jgi:hypothetical protein
MYITSIGQKEGVNLRLLKVRILIPSINFQESCEYFKQKKTHLEKIPFLWGSSKSEEILNREVGDTDGLVIMLASPL